MLCDWEKILEIKEEKMLRVKALVILDHKIEQMGQDQKLSLELGEPNVEQGATFSITIHGAGHAKVTSCGKGLIVISSGDGTPFVLSFAALIPPYFI